MQMLLQEIDDPMGAKTPIEAEVEAEAEAEAEAIADVDANADTDAENCSIEVDEADQAKLDTLTEQESRISTLLRSREQIQSLKEKYEEKLIQIASQLEVLTVDIDDGREN